MKAKEKAVRESNKLKIVFLFSFETFVFGLWAFSRFQNRRRSSAPGSAARVGTRRHTEGAYRQASVQSTSSAYAGTISGSASAIASRTSSRYPLAGVHQRAGIFSFVSADRQLRRRTGNCVGERASMSFSQSYAAGALMTFIQILLHFRQKRRN